MFNGCMGTSKQLEYFASARTQYMDVRPPGSPSSNQFDETMTASIGRINKNNN